MIALVLPQRASSPCHVPWVHTRFWIWCGNCVSQIMYTVSFSPNLRFSGAVNRMLALGGKLGRLQTPETFSSTASLLTCAAQRSKDRGSKLTRKSKDSILVGTHLLFNCTHNEALSLALTRERTHREVPSKWFISGILPQTDMHSRKGHGQSFLVSVNECTWRDCTLANLHYTIESS